MRIASNVCLQGVGVGRAGWWAGILGAAETDAVRNGGVIGRADDTAGLSHAGHYRNRAWHKQPGFD